MKIWTVWGCCKKLTTIFRSILSPYINLGLITPKVVTKVLTANKKNSIPINSLEGFVRQ